ncbi:MAG: hypothetical protein IPJ46_04295 [Anaerolineales bacterium]|nr:hypothetical protein [Anaerolineales bacterium]
MKYKTIRSLVRFVMNIIADVEAVGMDKLPQGNVILAANHLGRLDTAVLIYALEREDLIMAVAENIRDHPDLWRDRAFCERDLVESFRSGFRCTA